MRVYLHRKSLNHPPMVHFVISLSRFLKWCYPGNPGEAIEKSEVITGLFMATVTLSLLTAVYFLLFCFSDGPI